MNTEFVIELIYRTFHIRAVYIDEIKVLIMKKQNGECIIMPYIPNKPTFKWKTMKKVLENSLEDNFECPLCFEKPKERVNDVDKELANCENCGNTWCYPCLKKMDNTSCPFCRMEIFGIFNCDEK